MNMLVESLTTILLALVGVALLSVIVSRKSNTTGVIQAGASGFGNVLGVAESPVTGNSYNIDLSYPGGSSLGSLAMSTPLGF